MIKPTIGRVVLYHQQLGYAPAAKDPIPALVCFVHNDREINVGGFNELGYPISGTHVTLLQDDDPVPDSGAYARWMDYQKAQAAVASGVSS